MLELGLLNVIENDRFVFGKNERFENDPLVFEKTIVFERKIHLQRSLTK